MNPKLIPAASYASCQIVATFRYSKNIKSRAVSAFGIHQTESCVSSFCIICCPDTWIVVLSRNFLHLISPDVRAGQWRRTSVDLSTCFLPSPQPSPALCPTTTKPFKAPDLLFNCLSVCCFRSQHAYSTTENQNLSTRKSTLKHCMICFPRVQLSKWRAISPGLSTSRNQQRNHELNRHLA